MLVLVLVLTKSLIYITGWFNCEATAIRLSRKFARSCVERDLHGRGVAVESRVARTASLNVAKVTYRYVIVITSYNEVKFFSVVLYLLAG